MRRGLLILLAFTLAACGVQRPLIRPSQIPAFEKQQREKREQLIEEQRQLDAIDAQRAAEKAAQPKTEPTN